MKKLYLVPEENGDEEKLPTSKEFEEEFSNGKGAD